MKSIVAVFGSLGVGVLTGVTAFAADAPQPYAGPWPGWHGPWSGFWWVCPLMMFFMIALFAVFWLAFRRSRSHWGPPWQWMAGPLDGRGDGGGETALDILNKRFARGEIDKAEYGEIKAAILSNEKVPGQPQG
jgi:uncharacterized membrane protein